MIRGAGIDLLSGVCSVVHQQKFHILGVVNKEGLVTGGHHVASLLVAAVANLFQIKSYQHSDPFCQILQFPSYIIRESKNIRKAWQWFP